MPAALSVDKTMTKAKQASKNKDWVTAQALYQQVLDRFPSNKRAQKAVAELRPIAVPELLNLVNDAEKDENWLEARRLLEAASTLAPEITQITKALCDCLLELGDAEEALRIADLQILQHPNDLDFWNVKSRAMHELNRPHEARDAANRMLEISPDNALAWRNLGLVARSLGDMNEAESFYLKSLEQRPKDVALHLQLSHVRKYTDDDPHIHQMRSALAKIGKDNPASGLLHFALFEALHAVKQHDSAFEHLAKGNALLSKRYGFELRPKLALAALTKALVAKPLQEQDTPSGQRFIFVTGLPRSGTTLTERVLSRAPNVQACGELSFVKEAIVERFDAIRNRPDKKLTPDDVQIMRDHLLKRFSEISDGSEIQIDKMPLNFRWIGLICTALPEAKIVHLNRDPRAVAWSLYKHTFKRGSHDFIYKFEDIAGYMVLHRDLMKHWRHICGNRLFDLNYSDLVSDQLSTTQALAEAVGVEWTPELLSPEKATNYVRTSSAGQVTKPLYTGSDESWRTYETQLAPLMHALSTLDFI